MGMWARLKSIAGGDRNLYHMEAASSMTIPDSTNYVELTGTSVVTVSSLIAVNGTYNRLVYFLNAGSADFTFTNTSSPTTAGQMFFAGSNFILEPGDIIALWCNSSGIWYRVKSAP